MEYQEAVGCIHVHSTFSDGSGSIPELAEAGGDTGLDFLVLSDHNTMKARHVGMEGWYGRTLMIVGEEIGRRKGHVLAVGCHDRVRSETSDALGYLKHIQKQDGLSFVVHPDGRPKPQFAIGDARWKIRGGMGFTGIEVWSFMYDWIDRVQWWNLPLKILQAEKALRGPQQETLNTWDLVGREQHFTGYGGVDAHARRLLPGVKVFPYRLMFKTIRNHVLLKESFTGDSVTDRRMILDALASGRLFFAADHLADSTGFRFEAETGGQTFPMGSEVYSTGQPVVFTGSCPCEADITFLCDGKPCLNLSSATRWSWRGTEKGVYRIEARLKGMTWIYSNPVYVR